VKLLNGEVYMKIEVVVRSRNFNQSFVPFESETSRVVTFVLFVFLKFETLVLCL